MARVTGFQFHGSSKKLTIFYKDDPLFGTWEQPQQKEHREAPPPPSAQPQILHFPQLRLHVGSEFQVTHEIDPKYMPLPDSSLASSHTGLSLEYRQRRASGSGCSCYRDSMAETQGQLHPFAVHVHCHSCSHPESVPISHVSPPSHAHDDDDDDDAPSDLDYSVQAVHESDADADDGDDDNCDDPMLPVTPTTSSPLPWSPSSSDDSSDDSTQEPMSPPRLPPAILELSPTRVEQPVRLLFPLGESGDDPEMKDQGDDEDDEDEAMDDVQEEEVSSRQLTEMDSDTDTSWPPASWPAWMREHLLRGMVVGFAAMNK